MTSTSAEFSEDVESIPGFLFIDHLAISVKQGELDNQVKEYKSIGFKELHREEVLGKDQVREVLLQIGNSPNLIQLLEPLNETSPVQKLLDRNGGKGSMAHVGLRVKDIQAAFDYMKKEGFNIVDEAPRPGSRGTTVFFVHPKSKPDHPFGFLLEVVQEGKEAH